MTEKNKYDNMLILIFGGCCIISNLILVFTDSDIFKIVNFVAVIATLLSFTWFKLILLDEYVHSFWLKHRMRSGLTCIYGYGVDEFFVLSRFCAVTGIFTLIFVIINSIAILTYGLTAENIWIEILISVIFVIIYSIRLCKYDSTFSQIKIPLIASCLGTLLTSIIAWYQWILFGLFVFFVYCFIICVKEINSIFETLNWGDHAIVSVNNKKFDSVNNRFYLIYYTEDEVIMFLQEGNVIKRNRVDYVECVEKLPKASDGVDGWDDLTPAWMKAVERFIGFRIFGDY